MVKRGDGVEGYPVNRKVSNQTINSRRRNGWNAKNIDLPQLIKKVGKRSPLGGGENELDPFPVGAVGCDHLNHLERAVSEGFTRQIEGDNLGGDSLREVRTSNAI